MKNLKFEDLPSAIERILECLDRIEMDLDTIKEGLDNKKTNLTDSLMTRKEASEYLKVSVTTLWSWSKKGVLKPYHICGRVYFKRSEIDAKTILQS
ncbi:MAG: helix-turn-helix domain-containing protein [Bacteroidota bacterium]